MRSEVVIIGAGPAGAIAGSLLARKGHRVVIFEREHFPRFSIGESLLPQAMVWIEEAGLLAAVEAEGFQPKDGAVFRMGERHQVIEFRAQDHARAGAHLPGAARSLRPAAGGRCVCRRRRDPFRLPGHRVHAGRGSGDPAGRGGRRRRAGGGGPLRARCQRCRPGAGAPAGPRSAGRLSAAYGAVHPCPRAVPRRALRSPEDPDLASIPSCATSGTG